MENGEGSHRVMRAGKDMREKLEGRIMLRG